MKIINLHTLLTMLLAVLFSGCAQPVSNPRPLPAGHAEIHVEFKSIPTKTYNKLDVLVRELAEKHSAFREGSNSERDVGDRHSYHGWFNSGFSVHRYHPSHPVPSLEVEQAMRERLKTFLKDNKLDPDDAQLELRYGK